MRSGSLSSFHMLRADLGAELSHTEVDNPQLPVGRNTTKTTTATTGLPLAQLSPKQDQQKPKQRLHESSSRGQTMIYSNIYKELQRQANT